jgi:hypothetical protein
VSGPRGVPCGTQLGTQRSWFLLGVSSALRQRLAVAVGNHDLSNLPFDEQASSICELANWIENKYFRRACFDSFGLYFNLCLGWRRNRPNFERFYGRLRARV